MDFREKQAIYLQIAEYVCDQILLKHWQCGNKILSIRDLAVMMEVNPNTVQRAYDFLQQREIITNKRGIGYFADDDAVNRVVSFRKEQFIENELPLFFRNIYLLNVPIEDISVRYKSFINQNFKDNKDEK
ncbi:GntR family transcriptional regulator [Mucilaginibacter sp. RB4R14]|uniref:GntR family transcriptional regulator n=1 Tax=Mucilaginibacter aurantiaciroseus TaxID=2949308 RepID=UPI0020917E08|nr:GntR family transcriptional regulator [Mucilaginibacter aurantiaciroseus]MCO5936040.1 GntR family transcriptional regulator [Mucilaginibacter aurantiaciroseus]